MPTCIENVFGEEHTCHCCHQPKNRTHKPYRKHVAKPQYCNCNYSPPKQAKQVYCCNCVNDRYRNENPCYTVKCKKSESDSKCNAPTKPGDEHGCKCNKQNAKPLNVYVKLQLANDSKHKTKMDYTDNTCYEMFNRLCGRSPMLEYECSTAAQGPYASKMCPCAAYRYQPPVNNKPCRDIRCDNERTSHKAPSVKCLQNNGQAHQLDCQNVCEKYMNKLLNDGESKNYNQQQSSSCVDVDTLTNINDTLHSITGTLHNIESALQRQNAEPILQKPKNCIPCGTPVSNQFWSLLPLSMPPPPPPLHKAIRYSCADDFSWLQSTPIQKLFKKPTTTDNLSQTMEILRPQFRTNGTKCIGVSTNSITKSNIPSPPPPPLPPQQPVLPALSISFQEELKTTKLHPNKNYSLSAQDLPQPTNKIDAFTQELKSVLAKRKLQRQGLDNVNKFKIERSESILLNVDNNCPLVEDLSDSDEDWN